MKNVTLSADEALIRRARERAARENRSLNSVFREWLRRYAGQIDGVREYEGLMHRLEHVRSGRRFSREECNER